MAQYSGASVLRKFKFFRYINSVYAANPAEIEIYSSPQSDVEELIAEEGWVEDYTISAEVKDGDGSVSVSVDGEVQEDGTAHVKTGQQVTMELVPADGSEIGKIDRVTAGRTRTLTTGINENGEYTFQANEDTYFEIYFDKMPTLQIRELRDNNSALFNGSLGDGTDGGSCDISWDNNELIADAGENKMYKLTRSIVYGRLGFNSRASVKVEGTNDLDGEWSEIGWLGHKDYSVYGEQGDRIYSDRYVNEYDSDAYRFIRFTKPSSAVSIAELKLYGEQIDQEDDPGARSGINSFTIDGTEYMAKRILPDSGTLTAVTITQGDDITIPDDAKLYVALYKDNVLQSVKTADIGTVTEGANRILLRDGLVLPPPEDGTKYKVKGFVWDDMMPIFAPLSIADEKEMEELPMSEMSLWYDEPAAEDDATLWQNFADSEGHDTWQQKALPIGNGYMGAMVFGGVAQERVQLNEKTLWEGKPNHITTDRSTLFQQAREMALAGENPNDLLVWNWAGSGSNYGTYTSFGNLTLDFTNIKPGTEYSNYRRYLDLDNSMEGVTYEVDGITYTREYFASYPDRVMAMRLNSSMENNVSFILKFSNSPNSSTNVSYHFEDNTLKVTGALSQNGMRWSGEYRISANGGSVGYRNHAVYVSDADEAEIIMTMATDYEFNENTGYRTGIDPQIVTSGIMEKTADQDFDALYQTHIADYKSIYDNVKLELGGENDMPTDEMRARYGNDSTEDIFLDQLFYQYGRYMMISSSRAGSLPSNLQGVWADQKHPQWESDYHININLEMNYYPAANGNMIECMEPLLDWVEKTAEVGKQTAKNEYGCEGWVSHTCNNAFGFTDPGWGSWGLAFTPVAGTTKGDIVKIVTEQNEHLQTPVEIGDSGQIKEWENEGKYNRDKNGNRFGDDSHRHISQLVSLYPCNQITRRNPELLKAARTTLNARGDASTGWSRANKMLLWARAIGQDTDASITSSAKNMSNGDRAYTGSTAAIGELLVQSHDGYIDILPSLPTAWASAGSVKGLLAVGGFETDIEWADGKPVSAAVRSNAGGECRIFVNDAYGDMTITKDGKPVEYETVAEDGLNLVVFDTDKGAEYRISYK